VLRLRRRAIIKPRLKAAAEAVVERDVVDAVVGRRLPRWVRLVLATASLSRIVKRAETLLRLLPAVMRRPVADASEASDVGPLPTMEAVSPPWSTRPAKTAWTAPSF
jgi:hypothetical protein